MSRKTKIDLEKAHMACVVSKLGALGEVRTRENKKILPFSNKTFYDSIDISPSLKIKFSP